VTLVIRQSRAGCAAPGTSGSRGPDETSDRRRHRSFARAHNRAVDCSRQPGSATCSGLWVCAPLVDGTEAVASGDGLFSAGGCRFTHSVAGSAARLGDIGTSLCGGGAPAGTMVPLAGAGNAGGAGTGGVSLTGAEAVNVWSATATMTATDAARITAGLRTR
jgi:hypothetical protein